MSSGPVIMKFGGTSVGDAEAIGRLVRHIVTARQRGGVVVVVSALSKVTDRLLQLSSFAAAGDEAAIQAGVTELEERHARVVREVVNNPEVLLATISRELAELRNLLHAVATLKDASPRTRDAIAAFGELLSSRIVVGACEASGLPAVWADPRRILVTNDTFGAALPLTEETRAAAANELRPALDAHRIPVVGGYVGATVGGVTTTLGRGGSDYSAAIFGAALDAEEIQIWTDVDGMLTADPRVVSETQRGAAALLRRGGGARVLRRQGAAPEHDPAGRRQGDPGPHPQQSRRPEGAGTLITADVAGRTTAARGARLQARRHRRRHHLDADADGARLPAPRLRGLRALPDAVDVVTTSEVSVSVTIDDDTRLRELTRGAVGVRRGARRARDGDPLRRRRGPAARSARWRRGSWDRSSGSRCAWCRRRLAPERDRRAARCRAGDGDACTSIARSLRACRDAARRSKAWR